METSPPLPPFNKETAAQKVRMAENGWNSRDSSKVSLAYTGDNRWPQAIIKENIQWH